MTPTRQIAVLLNQHEPANQAARSSMSPIKVLLLSDSRPGHYHLAEGVIAALARVRPVETVRVGLRRRKWVLTKALRVLMRRQISPALLLNLGYGLDARALPRVDLVISAGRETIPANVAAARHLGAVNIFCGSLRQIPADVFSLVITSYDRYAALPNHIVTLKPSAMDPDALGRPKIVPPTGPDAPPGRAALLIGGDSGFFTYTEAEWRRLIGFIGEVHAAWGTRWIVSTSRRTPVLVGDMIAAAARKGDAIEQFLDYRASGPGTLPDVFRQVDAVLCTEDSSTMISEAVCARLPVVGVSPQAHHFKDEEAEYRGLMRDKSWCRFVPIAQIDVTSFGKALQQIRPLAGNHLDELAELLEKRLPALFGEP